MKRLTDFQDIVEDRWPTPDRLASYFFDPDKMDWRYGRSDDGLFEVSGLSEVVPQRSPMFRTSMATLALTGKRDLGVFLNYCYWDARLGKNKVFYSKGDLSLLHSYHVSAHGTPLPKGLFVPFPVAWRAVKHFMETDGGLASDVPWIKPDDLPADAFPDLATWQPTR